MQPAHDTTIRNTVFLLGAALASFLLIYAIKVNLMPERTPLVLDMPEEVATSLPPPERIVRPAYAAGDFYPQDPAVLQATVRDLLADVGPEEEESDPTWVIIAPHAGYDYSGAVAAKAFAAVGHRDIGRVVIVSRSHKDTFDHIAVDDSTAWATPLGEMKVDRAYVDRLIAVSPGIRRDRAAHADQHMIEVELPFVIEAFGADTKIVPLLFGDDNYAAAGTLAESLIRLMDERTLIVISSDLSHYPTQEDAEMFDAAIADAIVNVADLAELERVFDSTMEHAETPPETLACAEPAIATGVGFARSTGLVARVLAMATSADTDPSSADSAVGYTAIAFRGPWDGIAEAQLGSVQELDSAAQQYALAIARQSIMAAFEKKQLQFGDDVPTALDISQGVFVSMKQGEALRGSIGVFSSPDPLKETIRQMALAAAFGDDRFEPLTAEELQEVAITISVLSPLVRIEDPAQIIPGTHGVRVVNGEKSGVFLPQVATEMQWDLPTMMGELCTQKAGLSEDCWRDPSTELWIFTAQVIDEIEVMRQAMESAPDAIDGVPEASSPLPPSDPLR